jgi:hypothetical protein
MAGPNILNFASKVVFLNGQPITLPIAATMPGSATAGDMYYNSTTNTINYYNGATWITIGSGGGGSNPYYVETFVLSGTDISNQYVTLSSTPDTASDTILTVIGGPMQSYGTDFDVSGAQLNFSGELATNGQAALVSGDILVVQYD